MTLETYSGSASTLPSVGRKFTFPKVVEFTFACVSVVSSGISPVRMVSS